MQVSVDSCPVNCIHWVDREELAVLEFLIQPQPKEGYGVFGGGWERPANVFMAAKAFNKQLKRQADHHQRNGNCSRLIAFSFLEVKNKFSFVLNHDSCSVFHKLCSNCSIQNS